MGFPCIEWKDLKGASISQKGEEEIAGPEPSPGFKVRVSSKDPDLPYSDHEKDDDNQSVWGGSLG